MSSRLICSTIFVPVASGRLIRIIVHVCACAVYRYVGYALTTKWEGSDERMQVIGFDMGGTSTDVSRFAGSYEHVFESTTAGEHQRTGSLRALSKRAVQCAHPGGGPGC